MHALYKFFKDYKTAQAQLGQVQIAVFGKCTGALLTPNSKRNHVVSLK